MNFCMCVINIAKNKILYLFYVIKDYFYIIMKSKEVVAYLDIIKGNRVSK